MAADSGFGSLPKKRASAKPGRWSMRRPRETMSVTIEHGLIKLLVSRGTEVLDYRVAMANPQFFREGLASDTHRVAAIIQRNIGEVTTRGRRVLGTLPGYQSNLRRIDLPKSQGMDPATILQREARRTLGFTPETANLAWHRLPDASDRTRWIVFSANRRSIASFADTMAAAGLSVHGLEFRAFALARAVNQSDAVIAWTAMDGCDAVIVRDSIPVAHQSAYWGADPVEGSVLVNRLTEMVGRTIAVYDEQNLDLPLPDGTPLYVSGSPAALEPSVGQQVAANLGRPANALEPPLAIPPDFPTHDLIVNVGLALWEA